MNVPSYPFHSLSLKLSNKGMNFLFSPLKLPNKGNEEYSKIILFIQFHSFLPNEGLLTPNMVDHMLQELALITGHYVQSFPFSLFYAPIQTQDCE